ncbi:MAG: PilZ domain-containing protein [Nitrospirae bacterium]|nr:PilZ domain-containing protein [Nitrospirota bacterium]
MPAQGKPITDKRRHRRYKVHEGCRVTLNGSVELLVKDISVRGICLYVSRYLSADEVHLLKILSPADNEISLSGKVIWCHLHEDADTITYHAAGLNFIDMDESASNSLTELIRNCSRQ